MKKPKNMWELNRRNSGKVSHGPSISRTSKNWAKDESPTRKPFMEWKVYRVMGCAAALTRDLIARREGACGGVGVAWSGIRTRGGGIGD
jgi:hypothetical protein